MREYKIVARILLMLSVINFALTAPVVVREHEVRAIESNDGPVPSNSAPPIDSPSPLPGPAQSHSLSAGASTQQDVYTSSPVPTSQAPTDEPHPSPLAHGQGLADGSQESNPSSPLGDHLDVNSDPPSSLRFKYLSDLGLTHGDGASHPPGSPQIPTDTHSSSMSSGSWASQAHVSPPPNLPWSWSRPPNLPWSWSRPPNLPWRWSSRTRTGVPPPQGPEDDLSSEESDPNSWEQYLATDQHLNSPDQLATGEPRPPTLSTDDGPSPIPGPTDNHPQLALPSNPGPSMEPNPPPSAEPLHPEEHEIWGSLGDILKGKFKRHFSGPGSLNAE